MRIPADLDRTGLLVVAWTDHFFGDSYVSPRVVANEHGPDIRLDFTRDRSRAAEADALWFHAPSLGALPERQPGQKWVLMSMESDVNYPVLKNPFLDARVDVRMTYRLDSDVPCLYPNWRDYGGFLDPPPDLESPSPGALAVYIASNPVVHRDGYVRELMQHVPVDCPGRCLHNTRLEDFVPGTGWRPGGWASKLAVLRRYKFVLVFENSMTTDYVTERLFHALVSGVVPVYLGAPNVRDFLPHPEAAILVSDFDSPRELAAYLRELDASPEAYGRHLRWKRDGYSDRFRQLVDLGSMEPLDRLAVKLAHGCERRCRCGGRQRDPGGA